MKTKSKIIGSRFLAAALAFLLTWSTCLQGQTPAPANRLSITILEGEGVTNYASSTMVTIPVVEIRDQNSRPIEGAEVVFRAPDSGPGASFGDAGTTLSTVTDARGQAAASAFTPNTRPGKFAIQVDASYKGLTQRSFIRQANSLAAVPAGTRSSGKKKWIFIGLALAAGVGVGAWYALRQKDGPIMVNTGQVVIGGPR